MTVNIRTLDRRGETTDKVAAISNDPAGPKLLTVRFEVADELAAVPSRLHLGLARPGQTVRRRVKLVANVQADTEALYAISFSVHELHEFHEDGVAFSFELPVFSFGVSAFRFDLPSAVSAFSTRLSSSQAALNCFFSAGSAEDRPGRVRRPGRHPGPPDAQEGRPLRPPGRRTPPGIHRPGGLHTHCPLHRLRGRTIGGG